MQALRSWLAGAACVLLALAAAANASQVWSATPDLTPEEATRVGGDLSRYGKRLAVVRDAGQNVLATAPGAWHDLTAAWKHIADSPARRGFAAQLGLIAASFAILVAAVLGVRAATSRLRRRWRADVLRPRGAAGVLLLDALDRVVLASLAYVLVEQWFVANDLHDYLAVALLWAAVRWWSTMWLVQVLLRPRAPELRLVTMGSDCAVAITWLTAVALFFGIVGISVMPVLLRAGLPIPTGQFLVIVQGAIAATCGALGLWAYRRLEMRAQAPRATGWLPGPRFWFAAVSVSIALVWLSWTIGALLLKFSVYHSLVWCVRIAALAFVIDSVLGLSDGRPAEGGRPAAATWVSLARRSIRVAAIVAIGILFAELWLVDELALLERSAWEPIRRSLITAALTLVAGYVAWRYLHDWTEARLRAAVKQIGDEDDGEARPASRLTTVLPVLRILLGITIVVMAVLVALSQLGVNIAPLLAGAGVVGLAISFGSQALVRDIVSGIFFMTDDAFRVGEYIDTGKLKGTVEKITLRSVRLRHHNGQIHTIPFGQLTSITNFSRDWITLKFNVRLARDTDIELVRKTVKRIGLEMMQEPELGKEFLQPLKLQGVAEIADNALVVRMKFTARPAKPSWVQREALKRIYRVFGEKGIQFASGTITVQTAPATPLEAAAAAASASPRSEAA